MRNCYNLIKILKRKKEKALASKGKRLLASLNFLRTFPVFLCVIFSKQKRLIKEDVARWNQIDQINFGFFESLNWYLTYKKEFRNLLLHRLKHPSYTASALFHFFIAFINQTFIILCLFYRSCILFFH